jgi:hypothetical protein
LSAKDESVGEAGGDLRWNAIGKDTTPPKGERRNSLLGVVSSQDIPRKTNQIGM